MRVAEFQGRHPACLGMAKMLWDASRGLDVLESLNEVDASRLGAVGHSLGAKEALYLAAFDERVVAAVASEGGVGTTFSNWDAPWYLGPGILSGEFPREHHEVLALVAPRAFLILGGDSADGDRTWPFVEVTLPVWRLYDTQARVGLFNHRQGHSVPPPAQRRLVDWLCTYLRHKPRRA
jgi:pimeloyl-ACP methyl ester carboxylesterase